MRSSFTLVAAAVTLALSSAASATTYLKNGTVGSTGTYNLSVTTDNTIGALSSGNVTAWNIAISDGSNNFTLNQGNSAFLTTGGLSATATDLLFDFSASGSAFALFQNPTTSSGGPYFCWQSNGCFDFLGGGIGLAPTSNYSNQQITRLQGSLVVASVAGGVPEPGTWAMMLLGFAGIGMAVRRSRRSMRTRVAA